VSAESLNCPNCGAPLPDPAGRPTVVCDHCGSVIAFKPPPAAASEPAVSAPAEIDPHYDYGPAPSRRPARSELTSVALGPADAAHVIQLLRAGLPAAATQFYQSKVGGTPAEAQDAISAIQAGLQDSAAPVSTVAEPVELPLVREYLAAGNRLDAIRAYRQETGATLPEAEAAINSLSPAVSPVDGLSQPVPARSGARSCLSGCGSLAALAVVILLIVSFVLYGRSDYVRKTIIYKCGQTEITAQLTGQEFLTAPITGGYPVLVSSYHPAADVSAWTFSAEYYAPVWGANGWGIVDAHLADDSAGHNTVSARLYKDGRWRELLPAGQLTCAP